MVQLYRAISKGEKDDFDQGGCFRTNSRTLEVKQFFRMRKSVESFVAKSVLQGFHPPYAFILIVSIDEDLLTASNAESMILDSFDAISINEQDLTCFNKCIIFVEEEAI